MRKGSASVAHDTIQTARGIQIRERDGGNGYAGQSDPRLHFGIGGESEILRCEVRWPDAGIQTVELAELDRLIEIRQDRSKYTKAPGIEIAMPAPRERTALPTPPARVNEEGLLSALASMETELRSSLARHTASSAYRSLCAANGHHDRSTSSFRISSRNRTTLALSSSWRSPTLTRFRPVEVWLRS